jgi:hypothetical protein
VEAIAAIGRVIEVAVPPTRPTSTV